PPLVQNGCPRDGSGLPCADDRAHGRGLFSGVGTTGDQEAQMRMQRWSCRFVGALGVALIGCGQAEPIAQDESLVPWTSNALTVITGDPVVASTEDVTVTVPVQFNEPYSGMAQSEFPDGLPLSVGSGLRFRR